MLTIRLLGDLAVLRAGVPLPLPPSKKTRALLAYLVATGRAQRRERLCNLLWNVPDDPRGALRWSLSKLRPLVDEPDGGPARIVADRDTLVFVPAGASCDLHALCNLVGRGADTTLLNQVPTEQLLAVADGISGMFLEGLDLPTQPDFQAWCLAEREDVRRKHATLMAALTSRLAVTAPAEALPHARQWVELDPFDADARAALVRLLLDLNRRKEAEQHCEVGLRLLQEAGLPAAALGHAARDLRPPAAPARAELPTRPNPVADPIMVASGSRRTPPVTDPGQNLIRNIVIVDDEPEIGLLVVAYLSRHGYAARAATSGAEMDALLAEQAADLVILDVNLPNEDGFTIARRLQASGGPLILFLTAADEIVDRVAGLELGAEDYVTKPFDLRELRSRIGVVLRRAARAAPVVETTPHQVANSVPIPKPSVRMQR
jgi:CheY-like chemotaxis protein